MATRFYAPARLGEKQSMTPEGFLVCHDVAIARTGQMLYKAGEVDVPAGADGLIRIQRDEATVFHPDAMASFQGKPVVNDHPDGKVTPDNWREYAVGTIQNPRRGQGPLSDFIIADLLITDASGISAVRGGKREVSCGYDADYETVAPGLGLQRNIYGNHVALVERGRAGSRCAIGDQDMTIEAKPAGFKAALMKALGFTNDAELSAALTVDSAAAAPSATDAAVAALQKTVNGLGSAIVAFADSQDAMCKTLTDAIAARPTADKGGKEGDADDDEDTKKGKTEDAAAFADAAPRLEILSPGFSMPTHDAKADRPAMLARLRKAKCDALDAAIKTDAGKGAVKIFVADAAPDFAKLSDAKLDAVFIGASELMKASNNGLLTRDGTLKAATPGKSFGPTTDGDTINKANADFWASRTGTGAR